MDEMDKKTDALCRPKTSVDDGDLNADIDGVMVNDIECWHPRTKRVKNIFTKLFKKCKTCKKRYGIFKKIIKCKDCRVIAHVKCLQKPINPKNQRNIIYNDQNNHIGDGDRAPKLRGKVNEEEFLPNDNKEDNHCSNVYEDNKFRSNINNVSHNDPNDGKEDQKEKSSGFKDGHGKHSENDYSHIDILFNRITPRNIVTLTESLILDMNMKNDELYVIELLFIKVRNHSNHIPEYITMCSMLIKRAEMVHDDNDGNNRIPFGELLKEHCKTLFDNEINKTSKMSMEIYTFIGELYNSYLIPSDIIHTFVLSVLSDKQTNDMISNICHLLIIVGKKLEQACDFNRIIVNLERHIQSGTTSCENIMEVVNLHKTNCNEIDKTQEMPMTSDNKPVLPLDTKFLTEENNIEIVECIENSIDDISTQLKSENEDDIIKSNEFQEIPIQLTSESECDSIKPIESQNISINLTSESDNITPIESQEIPIDLTSESEDDSIKPNQESEPNQAKDIPIPIRLSSESENDHTITPNESQEIPTHLTSESDDDIVKPMESQEIPTQLRSESEDDSSIEPTESQTKDIPILLTSESENDNITPIESQNDYSHIDKIFNCITPCNIVTSTQLLIKDMHTLKDAFYVIKELFKKVQNQSKHIPECLTMCSFLIFGGETVCDDNNGNTMITFKELLTEYCKTLFDKEISETSIMSKETYTFIGELYNSYLIPSDIIHTFVMSVLSDKQTNDMISNICHFLKIVGENLEEACNFNTIIVNLEKHIHCDTTYENIMEVVNLQKTNWIKINKTQEMPMTSDNKPVLPLESDVDSGFISSEAVTVTELSKGSIDVSNNVKFADVDDLEDNKLNTLSLDLGDISINRSSEGVLDLDSSRHPDIMTHDEAEQNKPDSSAKNNIVECDEYEVDGDLYKSNDFVPEPLKEVYEEGGVHYYEDGNFWMEVPGLPECDLNDESHISVKQNTKVKFSADPIKVYSTFSMDEYDRSNEYFDIDAASAEYELEKHVERLDLMNVTVFLKDREGLGISIIEIGFGENTDIEKLGIFIKTIVPNGAVAKDGRIQVTDQIIEVNNKSLVGVTHEYATSVIRNTHGQVNIVIGRETDPENSVVVDLIRQSLKDEHQKSYDNDRTESSSEGLSKTKESDTIQSLGESSQQDISPQFSSENDDDSITPMESKEIPSQLISQSKESDDSIKSIESQVQDIPIPTQSSSESEDDNIKPTESQTNLSETETISVPFVSVGIQRHTLDNSVETLKKED